MCYFKTIVKLVGRIGFEPMTNGLKARALPAELTTQQFQKAILDYLMSQRKPLLLNSQEILLLHFQIEL